MGRILSNRPERSLKEIRADYEYLLFETLFKKPDVSLNINVLMYSLGYFSKKITNREKKFFLNTLNEYKIGHIPILVCLNIIKLWTIRFDQDYLARQTFFEPFPQDLMQITLI
jgi:uncharacterized protein YbgA (DUF1722 family)